MGFSLLAFDTDHIKRYVFGTDKLKEIRGASSLLDYLNRIVMTELATSYQAQKVYAHGGSGLFLLPEEQAEAFGRRVQRVYLEVTGGGAAVTYVWLPLPEHISTIGEEEIADSFELLLWRLQEAKLHPPEVQVLAAHPFMRLCDACGSEYADAGPNSSKVTRDPGEIDEQYCTSCQQKRERDGDVKKLIHEIESRNAKPHDEHMWATILPRLRAMGYDVPPETEQPDDFNVFRNFKGFKDYIGLIYADANNMGQAITAHRSLTARGAFAEEIDQAIYTSVCTAITCHLKVGEHLKPQEQRADHLKHPVFPFDILLMGGDDICMVVPASVAMDVALTLAETFREKTGQRHTLSVGVILAPIKYPFGLLQEMAETALKFAKKAGSDARAQAQKNDDVIDDTRINFMIVTGSSSSDFATVYKAVYHKKNKDLKQEFHATLRPYTTGELRDLLKAIRGKEGAYLGRSKLHQMRAAIMKMNLTTSVGDALAVLKNWRTKQRDYVVQQVYEFGGRRQLPRSNPDDPVSVFPRVSFPWFADGTNLKNGNALYRTSLLDFIELYDLVAREESDALNDDIFREGDANDDDH